MLIDINWLRKRREPLVVQLNFSDCQLGLRSGMSRMKRPAQCEMRVSLSGDQVDVDGNVKTLIELTCYRCSEGFSHPVQKSFDLKYQPDPVGHTEGEEFELSYTDLEVGFYREDQLDLRSVISEQIILEIPMKPLCKNDCKGLCDKCGANLNRDPCECRPSIIDPRWTVLSKVKKRLTK